MLDTLLPIPDAEYRLSLDGALINAADGSPSLIHLRLLPGRRPETRTRRERGAQKSGAGGPRPNAAGTAP
jgi:hypothetical protein